MEHLNEKSIFLAALAMPENERDEYLDRICHDEGMRSRIKELLRHHEDATTRFLEPRSRDVTKPQEAPDQIDEFRIIRLLGEGGMGVVYLAEDTLLKRSVALKVLANHLTASRDALARFVDEARNAAILNHKGIIPVYKFGFDGRYHYIASEFIDGPTLTEAIQAERDRRKNDTSSRVHREWHRRVASITASIAEALDVAHQASIIHRDVKPSNILIDKNGNARLTDFGIAKQLDEESLQTVVVGSCHYMSPEQASAAQATVDQRSDIFSLGVVLYESVTLRRPFDGGDVPRVLQAVTSVNPPRLRSIDLRRGGFTASQIDRSVRAARS